MVLFTIVAALFVYDSLDKFLSISGALLCTPIAFILPAMFHLKAGAETKC
jgi:amino acid permease